MYNRNKLTEKRIELGLTIAELSRLSGVSSRTISDIEKGRAEGRKETHSKILNGFKRAGTKYKYEDIWGSNANC